MWLYISVVLRAVGARSYLMLLQCRTSRLVFRVNEISCLQYVTWQCCIFFLISKVKSAATEMPFLLVFCPVVQTHGSVFVLMVGIFLSQSFLLFKIRQLCRWGYLTAWENPVCYTHT